MISIQAQLENESDLTPTLLYLSEAKRLGWFFCFLMIFVLFNGWTAIYLYLIKNLMLTLPIY